MELAPLSRNRNRYSFAIEALPEQETPLLEPGDHQGVYFSFPTEQLDFLLEKIRGWFADRDEITLIGYGMTLKKPQTCYILLEWEECEIDPLFLAILRDEPFIDDFSVYTREEVYE